MTHLLTCLLILKMAIECVAKEINDPILNVFLIFFALVFNVGLTMDFLIDGRRSAA